MPLSRPPCCRRWPASLRRRILASSAPPFSAWNRRTRGWNRRTPSSALRGTRIGGAQKGGGARAAPSGLRARARARGREGRCLPHLRARLPSDFAFAEARRRVASSMRCSGAAAVHVCTRCAPAPWARPSAARSHDSTLSEPRGHSTCTGSCVLSGARQLSRSLVGAALYSQSARIDRIAWRPLLVVPGSPAAIV